MNGGKGDYWTMLYGLDTRTMGEILKNIHLIFLG